MGENMVFLDWASTSPIVKYPCSNYGPFMNANANYAHKEKKLLKECEDRVKKSIGAKGGKVIFGGTSSQLIENLMNYEFEGKRKFSRFTEYCIGSKYEHDSFDRFLIDRVSNIAQLKDAIFANRGYRGCVFWQGTQNITGEVFPAKQIGELIHKYNGFYICDGTAQIGHTIIDYNIDDWCDFWCCSGHKLGTELGIGCCWISDRLDKWLNGFTLHGTPNLAGACAMADAVEDACDRHKLGERDFHYNELLDYLIDDLIDNHFDFQLLPEYEEEPSGHNFTSAIGSIRLPGIDARALQTYLASKDVYVGLGQSSCTEAEDNRVLCSGYGLSAKEASEVIRISFGENTSIEDIQSLVENICEFKKIYLDN